LPSPLYGLYRTRDDLSTLTVTVVYAVFACGAIVALLCEHVVVAVWKALPGLLVGRVITAVSVGLAAGTAVT
jgi:hypothetical protein